MNIIDVIDSKDNSYGTIKIVHRDQYGYVKNEYSQKIDSYIQQTWDKWFKAVFDGSITSFSFFNIGSGTSSSSLFFNWKADGGTNEIRGIIPGTNATAVAFTDRNLLGRISFGTSSNQLTAGVVTTTYDNDTGVATISRLFTNNNSGTDPTVRELGIAFAALLTSTNNMLGVRDVLDTPIQLFWKDTLEVTYTLEFTGGTTNWNLLFGKHFFARNQSNVMSLFNTTGSFINGTFNPLDYYPNFIAPIKESNRGIVVGTNGAAETFNTTSLYGKINSGTNTNELVYSESFISYTNTVSNGYYEYVLSRYFYNQTNSNIEINEVGLESNVNIGGTDHNFLFNRRNVSTILVKPNETKLIKWIIRYDF
jgi:hypothetical protein